jgi:hypothetical protein
MTYCWSPALVPKPTDWPAHIGKTEDHIVVTLLTNIIMSHQMFVVSSSPILPSMNHLPTWLNFYNQDLLLFT